MFDTKLVGGWKSPQLGNIMSVLARQVHRGTAIISFLYMFNTIAPRLPKDRQKIVSHCRTLPSSMARERW